MTDDLKLHDATLLSINTKWEEKVCEIRVDAGDGEISLVFDGVNYIEMPMTQPWGPSVSINGTAISLPNCWQIEMQTGDLITIKANNLTIKNVI